MVGVVAGAMVGTNVGIVERIATIILLAGCGAMIGGAIVGTVVRAVAGIIIQRMTPAPAETTDETTDKTIARKKVRRLDLALAAISALIAGALVILELPGQSKLATWIGLAIFISVIVVVGYRLMDFKIILLPLIL
jgi:hypothetical protein